MRNFLTPPFLPDRAWPREAPPLDRRFWLWHTLPIVVGVILLLLMDHTGLDLWISHQVFDPVRGDFPGADTFLFKKVLHEWAKIPFHLFIFVIFLLAVQVTRRGGPDMRSWKFALWFLFLAMLLSPLTLRTGKFFTDIYCPDQTTEFGGPHLYRHLFAEKVELDADVKGRCWPSGHAGTGFLLFAWYFFFHWMNQRKKAWIAFWIAMLVGNFMGFVQLWRGEHFLAHQFWSAIFCWLICLLLYGLFRQRWDKDQALP